MLKKYVMLFEMKAPIVHLLNEKQIEIFRDFLLCFCKPKMVTSLNASQLKSLKLTEENVLTSKNKYVGGKNFRVIQRSTQKEVIDSFLSNVWTSYTTTPVYLQKKTAIGKPFTSFYCCY